MRASLVIASHNEGPLLCQTVQSCLETLDGLDCEIVVADDASADGSVEQLRDRYPEVRVVGSPERRGVSSTKDRAARSARGEVVVYLDAHCKPEPGAIARMVRSVEAWDGAALVTPRVGSLDVDRWETIPSHVGYGFWTELEWFRHGWLGPDQLETMLGPDGRAYLRQPSLMGCCLALSRELYETLRGFDVGMLSYGSEDVDFGFKAWLMGYPIVLDTDALIAHRFRKRFVAFSVPAEHGLLNQLRMARKLFGEEPWEDWTARYRGRMPAELWGQAWALFEETRASVECERDYLMSRRRHDEYWYASTFGQSWPLTLPASPYPVPKVLTAPPHLADPVASPTIHPPDSPEPPPGVPLPTIAPSPSPSPPDSTPEPGDTSQDEWRP
jgi:GT2 family glycosyltransferase